MKTMKRVFSLLLFFVAAMSVQTVQAQTDGDVNDDGKVDEQDIEVMIKRVNQANDVVDNSTKNYYWYIGLANPTEMKEIAPMAADNTSTGWRYIGTSLSEYGVSNMLWNGRENDIMFEERDFHYIALPSNSIGIWLSFYSMLDEYNSLKPIVIDDVKFYVYKSKKKYRATEISLY